MYGHREERYHLTTPDIPHQITFPQYSDHRTDEIWTDTGIIPPLYVRNCIEYLHRNFMENEEITSPGMHQILPERIEVDPGSIAIASRENLMRFSRNCGIPMIGFSDTELALHIIQSLINDYSQERPAKINPVNHRHTIHSPVSHSGCMECCTACTPCRNPTGNA
jgi:hypothetical protein